MNGDETESYKERQDFEFESLQSIFGDELVDVRDGDAWKVYRPPEFILKLKPQQGMSGKKEVHTQLDLRVKFPPMYPTCCPELQVESHKGLSDDDVHDLCSKLEQFCKSSLGEVMILQIAYFIQEFLHNYNVAPYKSAYEEMVKNKERQLEREAKEEEKKREIQRKKEEIQRKEIEEELARRQEEERKFRKIKRDERDVEALTGRLRQDSEGSTNADPPTKESGVVQLNFTGKMARNVLRGQCLGTGRGGSVVYIGIDVSSGQVVAVQRWEILCPDRGRILTATERAKLDKYLKGISTVEQELQALTKLSHKHIVSFFGMRSVNCGHMIEVDILQEYVKGISLRQKVLSKEKVNLETLRSYTEQLLLALDYLHVKSVVHKQFKASSVFLDSNGLIKVADFSIGKRLEDMYTESHMAQPGVRFSDDRIPSRTSKKGDLLRLGVTVLSLALGNDVKDYPPEIPSAFPPLFQDFVSKCCLVDERLRLSAAELLEHEFIKPSVSSVDVPADTSADDVMNESFEEYQIDMSDPPPILEGKPMQASRLHTEFEQLEWLGKGGYGDVLKVRNKLDDRIYAIKRVLLNPHQLRLNRKITREVKLLSRLNHENVVRYYNSWMETSLFPREDTSESSPSTTNTTPESKTNERNTKKVKYSTNSLGLSDDIERMAPPPVMSSASDWSVSLEEVSRHGDLDDDDEEDVFQTIYVDRDDSSSESIMFEHSNDEDANDHDVLKTPTTTTTETTLETSDSSSSFTTKRFLLIQMEYCEKSTLRHTIDGGLCNDVDRMWRLFREILDGLAHVHEQGMIHRDLKPQNIFLDSHDHVKIGDFGLATAHSRAISTEGSEDLSSRSEVTDSMLTGAVGTALYVAPELLSSSKRTVYSQKVDIYSVGIIFFEMFYSGIRTKMERVKILGNLRTHSITFPSDFDEVAMEREAIITRWCLDHEPSKRPTAAELLKCRHVPTPILEESHVLEAVREMMVDPNSKQHSLVMKVVFDQPLNPTTSAVYDIEMQKRQFSITSSILQQQTHHKVSSILQRHGAVYVPTPLLLSRQSMEVGVSEAATFMDMGGTVVTLPYNLRVPFARFILCNNISSIKRYAIEKVFKARRVRCVRPRELWECAFDIVTPTPGSLIPDAEVISVVSEIVSAFPALSARKYEIKINHLALLKSIFLYCGLDEEYHPQAVGILASQVDTTVLSHCLSALPLTQQQIASLVTYIKIHGDLPDLQARLRSITRSKQMKASSLARQGLHDLEKLKKNLLHLQVSLPVTFDLGFSHKHQQHYSEMIFQVSARIQRKRHTAIDVLAIGGRYDALLDNAMYLTLDCFRKVSSKDEAKYGRPSAVGVSIAIDKVVAVETENPSDDVSDTSMITSPRAVAADVFVCTTGRSLLLKERLTVVKLLWDASISTETFYEQHPPETLQDVQDKAQERGVKYLVLVNEKESDCVTVKSLSDPNAKPSGRKVHLNQIVDHLSRKLRGNDEGSSTSGIKSSIQSAASALSSGDSTPSQSSNYGGTRQLSIELLPPDKLAHNVKKRHEFEIRTKLSNLSIIETVSSKTLMCAIAVELPSFVMKQLACSLDISRKEEEYNSSVAHHLRSVSKYKKYLSSITEKIYEVKFTRKFSVIILYSYKDDGYCLLV